MISLELSFYAFLYVSAGLVLTLSLWIYYDEREWRIYNRERAQSLFHCLKCGRLYSAPRNLHEAACPGCAFENSKLKF
ncbi:MAG: hypothetical protein ABSH19_01040 [Opitutales bacterium]